MSLPKGSENPPKKSKWIEKGWVVKKVKNQVICCNMSAYPPTKCKICGFFPVYADAYGCYKCPRCSGVPTAKAMASLKLLKAPAPAKTCPVCGWYPCYYDATAGCYKCPKGHSFK